MHKIGIKWEQLGRIVTRIHGFNDDNIFKSGYNYFWKISEIPDFFRENFNRIWFFLQANGHISTPQG